MQTPFLIKRALTFIRLSKNRNHPVEEDIKNVSMKEALINAIIVAGFNFFSTLAGISVAKIVTEPSKALIAAGIAAGLGFFGRLMVERGVKISTQQNRV